MSNKINKILEVRPVVEVSPICIADKPNGFGHDHFWQYPCATEKQAHENHITISIGENIDERNKKAHTYLGLPWATYIDRKLPYLKEFDYITSRLADLNSLCRALGYRLHVHTVCQHIHWQRIADWFKKLEVTDLHLSHCECRFLKGGEPWPYSIHSWPLIAASIDGLDVPAANESLKTIDERLYLASFVGAQMPHYRSDVRLLLQKEFRAKKEMDVLFELRHEWHYNMIVYEEQVAGRKLNNEELERQHAGISRYNQIISNSIYSLCPEGAGPNTLRIWESLALGAIPVIIADDWAPPLVKDSDLQLEDCCVFVASDEIDGLLEKLRNSTPAHLQKMQYTGKKLYEAFKNYRSFVTPALQEKTILSELNKNIHHSIFNHFQRVKSVGTGHHMFDFLGVATDVAFKQDWKHFALQKGASTTPRFPIVNEHYFDWIALLSSVSAARGVFRMAELGAGWGPWLVRGAFACRQNAAVERIELLGVEADPTHFHWMEKHFCDNFIQPSDHRLLHGAISTSNDILAFPKISNPDVDYGASLRSASQNSENIGVQGYTLKNLLNHFTGPIDLLHMDSQGVEYDVIPSSLSVLKDQVRYLVIGTHISQEKHLELYEILFSKGWQPLMTFPRQEVIVTEFGPVKFGDGFQFWQNLVINSLE